MGVAGGSEGVWPTQRRIGWFLPPDWLIVPDRAFKPRWRQSASSLILIFSQLATTSGLYDIKENCYVRPMWGLCVKRVFLPGRWKMMRRWSRNHSDVNVVTQVVVPREYHPPGSGAWCMTRYYMVWHELSNVRCVITSVTGPVTLVRHHHYYTYYILTLTCAATRCPEATPSQFFSTSGNLIKAPISCLRCFLRWWLNWT